MPSTHLLYLEDFNLHEATATVVDVIKENERTVIILNKTIFYAQGGGQPYDQGTIVSASGTFQVEEVRFVDGIIKHIGTFISGTILTNETVTCHVDKVRRELHNRLHSAGHVVDMGVRALNLGWTPGKGYHFPDGPYVEYAGSVEGVDKEQLKADLETACNRFIAEDRATTLHFMDKDKMSEVCQFVPEYLPEGKPARVVCYGDFCVPCGGTHVNKLSEIIHLTIRKIKNKGSNVQIAYDVSR